jgi:hypothetical protein
MLTIENLQVMMAKRLPFLKAGAQAMAQQAFCG